MSAPRATDNPADVLRYLLPQDQIDEQKLQLFRDFADEIIAFYGSRLYEQREMICFLRGYRYCPQPPHMGKLDTRHGRARPGPALRPVQIVRLRALDFLELANGDTD